jgi:hypothetical protein
MLIDDMRAFGSVPIPPTDGYFDVTSAYDALPEEGWQEWVRRLLDTTPARPPYPLSWWEFRDAAGGALPVRFGVAVAYQPLDIADRALAWGMPAEYRGSHAAAMRQMRDAGAVSLLLGTLIVQHGRNFAPAARIMVALDRDDRAIPHGEGYLCASQPLSAELAAQPPDVLVNACWQMAYFVALTHVRNIAIEERPVPPKMQRARVRRGKPPLVTFKTLVIRPLAALNSGGTPGAVQGVMPLHLVRGNFAHYGPDNRLFGRYEGTFWRPAHIRGEKRNGLALKDYRVEVNA